MSTSLASQLSGIRSLNAARLSSAAAFSSQTSYLFPPRTAAGQDLETIYSLGETGWSELCIEDASLERWSGADRLFGIEARNTDRTMLGKEENAALDATIQDFFDRVGAILLHKSTAKCLEWLVRRFRIHEFNALTVLRAFMPFHQTPQFAKMLAILNLSSESHLAFLRPLQKTVQPLPTSVLLSALLAPASNDTLRFVNSVVTASATPHRAQILFWSATLVQFCARSAGVDAGADLSMGLARKSRGKATLQQRQDNAQLVLSVILPSTIDVIRRKKIAVEAQLAGCLVLSAIGASFDLSAAAVASAIHELACAASDSRREPRLLNAIIAAAASLCGAATSGTVTLTPATLNRFLASDDIQPHIAGMSRQFDLSAFLAAWVKALVENIDASEKARAQMLALLTAPAADSGLSPALAQSTIEGLLTAPSPSTETLSTLAQLRQRKAPAWDAAVRRLTSDSADVERKTHVVHVVRQVTRVSFSAIPADSSSSSSSASASWVDLNSAESSQRILAVESLLETIASASASSSTDAFTRDALVARIADDEPRILEMLYGSNDGQTLLNAVPSSDALLKAIEVACAPSPELSRSVLAIHLRFLLGPFLSHYPKASNRVVRNILWPYLLETKSNRKLADTARGAIQQAAKRAESSDDLKPLLDQLRGVSKSDGDNAALAQGIASAYTAVESESHWNAHVSFLFSQAAPGNTESPVSPESKALALLVLAALLRRVTDRRFAALSQRFLRVCVDGRSTPLAIPVSAPAVQAQSTPDLLQYVHDHAARSGDLLMGHALVALATSLRLEPASPAHLVGLGDISGASSPHLALARSLYAWANGDTAAAPIARSVLAVLFGLLKESTPAFLAGIWIKHDGDARLATTALKHTRAFLSAHASYKATSATDFQTLVPSLLIAAMNDAVSVRREAVENLRLVTQLAKNGCSEDAAAGAAVWGYDGVYGPGSEDLKYLDCPSTYRFCFELETHAEALVSDGDYLPALLGGALTTAKGQDKKEANFRRAVMAYLLSHIAACPAQTIQLRLLQALPRVHDASKLSPLLPLIRRVTQAAQNKTVDVELSQLDVAAREELLHLLFAAYDRRAKAVVEDASTGAWQLLLSALGSGDDLVARHASAGLRSIYPALHADLRRTAVEELARVLADPLVQAPREVRETLANLDIDAGILVVLLAQLRSAITDTTTTSLGSPPSAKKAKTDVSPRAASNATLAMLTEMLESALSRALPPVTALIAELFEILRTVIELHTARSLNGDYLLHLTMSNLTKQLGAASRTRDVVQSLRVDTVINVVKVSNDPSTFQQALLLLSNMAKLAPETVIHSAMPIFTFVGSTVLQRDDAFSFSVVERVLESVIPPLVKHLAERGSGDDDGDAAFATLRAARPFLCIFTDSATHIPRHRRQNFFQRLVEVFGPEKFTAALCMLLVDRASHKVSRQTGESALTTLQLPLAVLHAQRADVQLKSMNEVWTEAERLWQNRDVDAAESDQSVFLSRLGRVRSEHGHGHGEKQVDARAQIISLLAFLTAGVSRRGLRGVTTSSPSSPSLDDAYYAFIDHALRMQEYDDEDVADHASEALSTIMHVVPVATFMSSVERLLAAKTTDKALRLVAQRFPQLNAAERQEATRSYATTTTVLAAVREQIESGAKEESSTALDALHAIAVSSQPQEHAALAGILPGLLTLLETAQGKRSRAFAILSALAGSLGPRLIAHLKRIVALCMSTPTNTTSTSASPSLEVLAKLLTTVPSFMEPFVQSLVELGANAALKAHAEQTPSTSKALNTLLTTLIKRTAADKVLNATFAAWKHADHAARLSLLGFLQRVLRLVDRAGVASNYKAIFRFILQVLDGRRVDTSSTLAQVRSVEDSAIRAFVKLVMKLNETTFRPLFLRIFDWAALDLADDDMPVSDAGLVARRIALYKVNNALHDQLRGLISHYYSTVLDLSIELLDAFRASRLQNAELWTAVVASIHKSAQHDEGNFWNPARLSKLSPAFIGQLAMRNSELVENVGGSAAVSAAITPAVANLARVVPDEASLKVINGALLAQLRQDVVHVRVATLNVLTDTWSESSLSNVLLGLVPETVPHIAELMEVDDPEIVDATRGFVAAVEGVLGESIDEYVT